MSTILVDANGFKTLDPVPTVAGADVINDNTLLISVFVDSLTVSIGGNTTDVAANLLAIQSNDTDILALQNAVTGISVTNYGTAGDGTTDDKGALSAAEDAAKTAGVWLLFPPGTYLINTNITFRVPVLFLGGILRLAATKSATFNEPYMNPSRQQCFDEQGRIPTATGGVVVAETSPQTTVREVDWGANFTRTDNQLPIQQAIGSLTYGLGTLKFGQVLLSSGRYSVEDSLFVGYDFVNFPDGWTDRTLVTKYNISVNTTSPATRKSVVTLRSEGFTRIRYVGNTDTDKYLLYYSGRGSELIPVMTENVHLDCNGWKCRGAIFSRMRYFNEVKSLTILESTKVAVDWLDCFDSPIRDLYTKNCNGFGLRTLNAGSGTFDHIKCTNFGDRDEHWPDPTESFIVNLTGNQVVQTPVDERAAVHHHGGAAQYRGLNFEAMSFGSPMLAPVVSDVVTRKNHGLQNGDPIRIDDANNTAVDPITSSTFTLGSTVADATYTIYRRATNISTATPGVVTCANHGLATDMMVKITAASGMTSLNDTWFKIIRLTDDTFSLHTETGAAVTPSGVSDETEYLSFSVPGLIMSDSRCEAHAIRFEGSQISRSLVVLLDQALGIWIDGVMVEKNATPSDWVVECRKRQSGNKLTRLAGSTVNRASVLFEMTGSSQNVGGCIVENTLHEGDPSVGPVEWILNGGSRDGNLINGGWTPLTIEDDDETPSVWGAFAGDAAKNWVSTGGARVHGPILSVTSANARDITNFDDGYEGQVIQVLFKDNNNTTLKEGSTIKLTGGVDLIPPANSMVSFVKIGNAWYQA